MRPPPDDRERHAYRGALDRLAALARFGMRPGLEPIRSVLAALGDPQLAFPSLHIAGTNGKGSTAAFAEAMLREAGARTGLYTSPHLLRFTERLRVDGAEVGQGRVAELIERVMAARGGAELTFFEVATAAAFVWFAEEKVDVAVVECGLGGRLDATNLCAPFASVITRIALDHTEVLGPTLEAIAAEKAGIARAGVPLLVGPLADGPRSVIEGRARAVGAPLLCLGRELSAVATPGEPWRIDYRGPGGALDGAEIGLAGAHQAENAALALAAVAHAPKNFAPDEAARRQGLRGLRWPARLERVAPDLRLDAAHNPDGAAVLARALEGERAPVFLIGLLADKDADGVLAALLPLADRVICTSPDSPRALPALALAERARRILPSLHVDAVADPMLALAEARRAAAERGTQVVACGSIFLVGALRGLVLGEERDPVAVSDPTLRPGA